VLIPGVSSIMATSVFLRLQEGRRVRFGYARDAAGAARVKAEVERWIHAGTTLTVTDAHGAAEDIAPTAVAEVELVQEPTPTRGAGRRLT